MGIQIATTKYEASHGRKPKGYGSWGFVVMDDSCGRAVETFFTPMAMTLTEARKWATNHVREKWAAEVETGFLYLEVAP